MNITTPESSGMSSERLRRIDTVMEDFVKDNQLPGIMTLLQRRGKVVQLGKYGMMDIEAGNPVQENAIYRIYSMTKPITSIAVMMLCEQGKLSLSDPVSDYIPAFAKTKVYAEGGILGLKLVEQDTPMTIYHLLTHTSGLSYGWYFDSPVEELYRQATPPLPDRTLSLEERIETAAALPLLFQPGTQWRYSIATDVLGYLVQVVANMPFADYLHDRIFKPLGMLDTGFDVPESKVSRLAQIYTADALYNPRPIAPHEVYGIGDVTTPTQNPVGGGGLVSTLADYLKFCNCLMHKGAYEDGRLISRKTLELMIADHTTPAMKPLKIGSDVNDHGFGLGFRIMTNLGNSHTLTSVGEYGWGGAAKTYFWVDPAEELIGLFMTQHLPLLEYPVTDRFINLAYQAIVD